MPIMKPTGPLALARFGSGDITAAHYKDLIGGRAVVTFENRPPDKKVVRAGVRLPTKSVTGEHIYTREIVFEFLNTESIDVVVKALRAARRTLMKKG